MLIPFDCNMFLLTLLLVAGLIPSGIALFKLSSSGIKWSFLCFMGSSLLWIGQLVLFQSMDPVLAAWVSRSVFASFHVAMLSSIFLTAFVIRQPLILRSKLFWSMIVLNTAMIGLALAGQISVGIEVTATGNQLVFSQLYILMLIVDAISFVYSGYLIIQSLVEIQNDSNRVYQLKYYGIITLITALVVLICNTVIPRFGTQEVVLLGPLALVCIYWGYLRFMMYHREIFIYSLFRRVLGAGFLENSHNFLQFRRLLLALENLFSDSVTSKGHELVLETSGGVSMRLNFQPRSGSHNLPGGNDPGLMQRMQETINRLYRENLDYAMQIEQLEEQYKHSEVGFAHYSVSSESEQSLVSNRTINLPALPPFSIDEINQHTAGIHQELGQGPYELGQLLQFMDIEPIEGLLEAGRLNVVAMDTFDLAVHLPLPA